MSKPTLCVDFDGVIHLYSRGWQEGIIYDPVTDGFFEWARHASEHFNLAVFSSRSRTPEGILAMRCHIAAHFRGLGPSHAAANDEKGNLMLMWPDWPVEKRVVLAFPSEKPPAHLYIDDRACLFEGDWSQLDPEEMLRFRPWNVEGPRDEVQDLAESVDATLRLVLRQHERMRLALQLIGSSAPQDSDVAELARKTLEEIE